jgi:hypothetical protein
VMWQFTESIDGISEACRALETPITGGNVSFYNETLGNPIYPTPILGVLGLLEDADCALGSGFRNEGDLILLLDANPSAISTDQQRTEFSSSEYAKTIHGSVAGAPPAIDLTAEKNLINCLVSLASEKAVVSAHDLSDGGLAVALAECCFDSADDSSACLSAAVDLAGVSPGLFNPSGVEGQSEVNAMRISHGLQPAEHGVPAEVDPMVGSPGLQPGEHDASTEVDIRRGSPGLESREHRASAQVNSMSDSGGTAGSPTIAVSPGLQSGEHGPSGRATSGASPVGALAPENTPAEYALFGERGARAVVSLPPASLARATAIAAKYSCNVQRIGIVIRGAFRIQYHGTIAILGEVSSLREIWSEILGKALESA